MSDDNLVLQPHQGRDTQFHAAPLDVPCFRALTPLGHEMFLIDGNAQPMDEDGIARYVREPNIGLVGDRSYDPDDRQGIGHGRRGPCRWRAGRGGRSSRD